MVHKRNIRPGVPPRLKRRFFFSKWRTRTRKDFKPNVWHNFGDIDPKVNGGYFIKYDPDFREFHIVRTINIEEELGEGKGWLFLENFISLSSLLQPNGRLTSEALEVVDDFAQWNDPIWPALLGWQSYYGEDCWEEHEKWKDGLESFGITRWRR